MPTTVPEDHMKKRLPVIVFIASALLLAGIQLIPVSRTNPPVETEIAAPAGVQSILRQACYNCHSNMTAWPWYSRVAPISWLVAGDVREARGHLNFTTWNRYSVEQQVSYRKEIWKEVEEDGMPPLFYRLMHPEARLSAGQKAALRDWATSLK
jgi:hypothetical protein